MTEDALPNVCKTQGFWWVFFFLSFVHLRNESSNSSTYLIRALQRLGEIIDTKAQRTETAAWGALTRSALFPTL